MVAAILEQLYKLVDTPGYHGKLSMEVQIVESDVSDFSVSTSQRTKCK